MVSVRKIKNFGGVLLRLMTILAASWSISCDKTYPSLSSGNYNTENLRYAGIFMPFGNADSSHATGQVSVTYNGFTQYFDFTIKWDSLTSLPIAIRVYDNTQLYHDVGVYPRVISDSVSGTTHLGADMANDLASGHFYVLIHTIKYPDGEAAASLSRQ